MTRYEGDDLEGVSELGYEQALEALLSLIGRRVLVLFSGVDGSPFISGIVSGRLDRGELDERLQQVLLRADDSTVETLFFHVGSRENGFVIRPDEFKRGLWRNDNQLVLHVGRCASAFSPAASWGARSSDDGRRRQQTLARHSTHLERQVAPGFRVGGAQAVRRR